MFGVHICLGHQVCSTRALPSVWLAQCGWQGLWVSLLLAVPKPSSEASLVNFHLHCLERKEPLIRKCCWIMGHWVVLLTYQVFDKAYSSSHQIQYLQFIDLP